jgi:hypothetical protein
MTEHVSDERVLFDHLQEEDKAGDYASVLDYITIDGKGGLSKVHGLIPPGRLDGLRVYNTIAKLGMLAFNLYMVVSLDFNVIGATASYYGNPDFMSTHEVLPGMTEFVRLTENHSLITVSHTFAVHLAELLVLWASVILGGFYFLTFVLSKEKFDSFSNLHYAFENMHSLRAFSAVKLFAYVHPEMILRYFELYLSRKSFLGTGTTSFIIRVAYFVFTRLVALSLGVLAFSVKLTFVSFRVNAPHEFHTWKGIRDALWSWAAVLSLLWQAIGAVNLHEFMLWRMLLIIAGGRDARPEQMEGVMKEVYLARLTQALYSEYWGKGRRFSFLVLMLTFDDRDLQSLLIDEDLAKRSIRFGESEPNSPSADATATLATLCDATVATASDDQSVPTSRQ